MTNTRWIENSRGLFALLLNLYPRDHRADYANSMLQVFTDQCRCAYQDKGRLGIFFLWLRTLPDLGYTAFVEHLTTPQASWGLMEPVPNAPLPWKGVLLILLPGLVYLISQIAQLTGQPWYLVVYYRAAFYLIIPPVVVWIFTRRFPLWGLIPVGLLFRLAQEIGYQLVTLHPNVFSGNPLLNAVLSLARTVQSNPLILAGVFTLGIIFLGWRYLRQTKPARDLRGFWIWGGMYLLVGLLQILLSWWWILPSLMGGYPGVSQIDASAMFRISIASHLYNFSAFLFLVFVGTLFNRRHGLFTILILVGYILPTQVVGIPWELETNPDQVIIISTAVLSFRMILSFIAPIWMSRTASQSGKKRIVLILAGLALTIHAVMQFYPGIFLLSPATSIIPEWVASVVLDELELFSALLLGLVLYQTAEPAPIFPGKVLGLAPGLDTKKA